MTLELLVDKNVDLIGMDGREGESFELLVGIFDGREYKGMIKRSDCGN